MDTTPRVAQWRQHAESGRPFTLADGAGREVTIDAHPRAAGLWTVTERTPAGGGRQLVNTSAVDCGQLAHWLHTYAVRGWHEANR